MSRAPLLFAYYFVSLPLWHSDCLSPSSPLHFAVYSNPDVCVVLALYLLPLLYIIRKGLLAVHWSNYRVLMASISELSELIHALDHGLILVDGHWEKLSTEQAPQLSISSSSENALRKRTIRVRGLPAGDHKEVATRLEKFLDSKRQAGEYSLMVTIVPSCDPKERELDALLDLTDGKLPAFLSALASKTPETIEERMDGHPIAFDAHFHGFTQLYSTRGSSPATAE